MLCGDFLNLSVIGLPQPLHFVMACGHSDSRNHDEVLSDTFLRTFSWRLFSLYSSTFWHSELYCFRIVISPVSLLVDTSHLRKLWCHDVLIEAAMIWAQIFETFYAWHFWHSNDTIIGFFVWRAWSLWVSCGSIRRALIVYGIPVFTSHPAGRTQLVCD
jgi:hypothetical protein